MGMLERRTIEVVTPFLEVDENIEITTLAMVGIIPVKQNLASAAAAAAVGVAFGSAVMVLTSPKKFYIALTDRRLLFFEEHKLSGRPIKKVAWSLPRQLLHTNEPANLLIVARLLLTIDGQANAVKLTFPLPAKRGAAQLAAALNGSTSATTQESGA
ncbi:hypothetical protein F0L68_20335 [Solihabitans fulvus]|uniref:PH domain-containing protein n=1 Tax=Solihabitans fulvus TaxID=1892852 RepID=A0A5B2XAT9_9PSEU|nr:hypothetical protein [Solihabitans fulvus]KAA2260079.1 hypothetical protein F0L68_20335 [Solihabitans fulvus]